MQVSKVFQRWLSTLLLVGLAVLANAQTSADNPVTTAASGPTPEAGIDETDFFDSGSIETKGTSADTSYKETFTTQQPIQFGGSFQLKLQSGIDYYRDFSGWTAYYFLGYDNIAIPSGKPQNSEKVENSSIDLQGSLFFSARPSNSLRLYGKTKISYPFALTLALADDTAILVPNIKIWELFADFNLSDAIFFRAGKQMIKWGVGSMSFWSPADVLSLSTININDRSAELEGPVAIKANIPFSDNNLDFYLIAPANADFTSVTDLGYAARAKFLLGGWELGAGVVNQKVSDLKFIGTASGSIWKFNVWGEALVNRRSDNFYIAQSGSNYAIGGARSDWFFSGTAGLSYANPDIYLDTIMLQYYYNGMGTNDMTGAATKVRGYLQQASSNGATAYDLAYGKVLAGSAGLWTGRHYLALTAQESFVHDSTVHLVATWLADLSDGSGTIMPGVNFDISDEIGLGLLFTINYGPADGQFTGIAGVDGLQQARFKMGLSLSLGTGNF